MEEYLLLDAGSGGRASQRLIGSMFLRHFSNEALSRLDDAALLNVSGPLAMSTDSYTVSPLFFAGGSIGTLAVHGTVNDISMLGAEPRWLSCAFILEEGLPLAELEKVVADMGEAARKAGGKIVTGDTKVVPKGACDKIFINTSGIGEVYASPVPSGHSAKTGDVVLASGTMGDHGLAIMAARSGVSFLSGARSDSAPLNGLAREIYEATGCVHVLRDPTRGGLATTLNEIAEQSGVEIEIEQAAIPINEEVKSGCSFLGLDPLYLANEGKLICIVPENLAQKALFAMRANEYGQEAAIIGQVREGRPGRVALRTEIGGKRLLGMLEGAQLPRIC